MTKRYAHSVPGQPEHCWEPLSHHLAAVGGRAGGFADFFGAATIARVTGLLHDIGKCSLAYQQYIRCPKDKGGPKGPDHSTAGAKEAVEAYRDLGRLMAFGLAGHHSGLMDGAGYESKSASLNDRLKKEVEPYDGWWQHITDLPAPDALRQSVPGLKPNAIEKSFSLAFLARMLFSCLVDADFLETEAFYARSDGGHPPDRGGAVRQHHLETVRAFLAKHRKTDSEVNRLRSAILDHANAKAALPPGLFTLTVPTGGGKTLTSLSFALEHALRHGLRRVVYVIPFTSIIEQTAQVFREDVGLGDAVLEHHSSFDWDKEQPKTDDTEGEGAAGMAKLRRDTENWDAPIVVTTAVQFFESLFAARTSQARKLHNLAKSVIILDEAQSIPVHLLRPCMAAIDELARNYGASIVLCTATQPALRTQDEALPRTPKGAPGGLEIPEERELKHARCAAHARPARTIGRVAPQEFLREIGAIVPRKSIGIGRQRRADGDGGCSDWEQFPPASLTICRPVRRPRVGATLSATAGNACDPRACERRPAVSGGAPWARSVVAGAARPRPDQAEGLAALVVEEVCEDGLGEAGIVELDRKIVALLGGGLGPGGADLGTADIDPVGGRVLVRAVVLRNDPDALGLDAEGHDRALIFLADLLEAADVRHDDSPRFSGRPMRPRWRPRAGANDAAA